MKKVYVFLLPLAMLLCACCAPSMNAPEPCRRAGGPAAELSDIDSLMWRQPDSAFALLQRFAASPMADSLDEYNTHYFHLLLAELLYKNDCAQTNRPNVLQAADYFDSLTINSSRASCRHCGRDPQSPNLCGNFPFLDARAHYINGVGYYEKDSEVQACAEYLKALEVMEEHYEEKELVGLKARFMVYTYNRLGDLFSSQYMMEPAIECFARSYEYSLVAPISPYSLSSSLHYIGIQYDKLHQKDSAYCYYKRAVDLMPDTNSLFYRDLESSCALLSYQLEENADSSLQLLHRMMQLADDEEERLTRCLSIGAICFEESRFDSALHYLEPVFRNTSKDQLRIQSADYLHIICDSLRMNEKTDEYIRFIAANKESSGQSKAEVSQLNAQFKAYKDKKQERQSADERTEVRKTAMARTLGIVLPVSLAITLIIVVVVRKKNRKTLSEKEAERLRLQDANTHLKTQLIQQSNAQKAKPHKAPASAYEALMKETVCIQLVQRIRSVEIITTNKPSIYSKYAASAKEKRELANAVEKHCPDFGPLLKAQCPDFTRNDFELCRYLLIGILEPQVAILLQKDYSTVWKRVKGIKQSLQTEEPELRLRHILFEDSL